MEKAVNNAVLERISHCAVLPIMVIDEAKWAVPIANCLSAEGLSVIEITLRTPGAADVIFEISRSCPKVLVGAGTVLGPEEVKTAKAHGAAFAVAPGLNLQTVTASKEAGLPLIPGVATPTEIGTALGLGFGLLKFFPAEMLGGVRMLEALSQPYHKTGVRFIPTGGLNAQNFSDYLRLDTTAAVGGTWLVQKEDFCEKGLERIRARAREVSTALRALQLTT